MQAQTRREVAGAAAILFVFVNLVFAPFLWGDRTMMSSADEAASIYAAGAAPAAPGPIAAARTLDPGAAAWQTEPEFALEHQMLARGELPLWNPYVGFGQPFAANMIAQPYYPLTAIVDLNASPRAYNWYVALRFWLAGFFAFLFLRYFVRTVAALAGGSAFAFTGYLVLYYDLPHISVEVLVPALLWSIERAVRSRDRASVGVVALVSAAVVFGGMPESAFLAFAFAVVYAVVRILSDSVLRKGWRADALRLGAGFALGALASGIAAVPFLEFLPISQNTHAGAGSGGQIVGLVTDHWDPRLAVQYLAPLMFGLPFSNELTTNVGLRGYWGVAAAFFALVTVVSAAGDRIRRVQASWSPETFFAIAAAVLLLKRFGVPLVQWIGLLPGFSLIVFPKYEEILTGMSVAALAAFGIERIASGRAPRYAVVAAGAALLAVLTAGLELAGPASGATIYLHGALAWSLAVLAAVAALAWFAPRTRFARYTAGGAATIVALDVVSCFLLPLWYVVTVPPPIALDPEKGAPYVAFVQRATERTHERFLGLDALLYPEWSSAFGILDVRDLNPLTVRTFLPFARAFLTSATPSSNELVDRFGGSTLSRLDDPLLQRFLTLSSVRYVARHPLTRVAAKPAQPQFATAFWSPDAEVLRFADPLPRIAVYTRVVAAADDAAALQLLASPHHDVWNVAVVTVSGADASSVAADLQAAPGRQATAGTLERYDSRNVVATVDAPARALAVLDDTDFPGWRATVDDRAAPIVRANGLFRGVEVPPGRHRIAFRYEPASFTIGLVMTVIGLAISTVLVLARFLPGPVRKADSVTAG